jgi:hypothetical protein
VRTADLLAGLAETRPHDTATVLQLDPAEVTVLAWPPASEPDLVPMANEPALREALVTAYRRAEGQPITPAILLTTLAPHQPRRACVARPVTIPGPSRPVTPADWDGEQAADVLEHWLTAQSLPPGQREAEIGRISLGAGGPTRS